MIEQNLHTRKHGWNIWSEMKMNQLGMSMKSFFWLLAFAIAVVAVTIMITTTLGIYSMSLSGEFYEGFVVRSFRVLFHDDEYPIWHDDATAVVKDIGVLLLVHSPIGIAIIFFGYQYISNRSSEFASTQFIAGTKLISEVERLKSIGKMLKAKTLRARFFLGRIPVPFLSETTHFLIVAATGGGKGVLLSRIMKWAGGSKNIKGFVHDRKPEWVQTCFREDRGDLIFNPLDKRSIKWTVWNDIDDIIDLKSFAGYIIPDMPGKDPFWQNSARGILESILVYLWKKEECTNAAIRRLVNTNGEELAELLKGLPGADYARKQDSMSTLRSQMAWVDFLPDGDFSIKRWLVESERGLIFLTNTEKTQSIFKPALSLFVNVSASSVLQLEDDRERRIFFFLDEFTSLHRLEKIIDLLKLGRSKGAALFLAFQDFQQLKQIYNDNDMHTVINNCKSVAIGQVFDPEAANYLAKRFGEQEFYERSQTLSSGVAVNRDGMSLNEQRKRDLVVHDYDLINLEARDFYIKIDGYEGVTKTTADIIELTKIADGFIPVELTKEEQVALLYTKNIKHIKKDGAENCDIDATVNYYDREDDLNLDDDYTL